MPKTSEQYLQSRRRSIIQTARKTYATRGFAQTSMSDLVAATGLSMGTLYRYFPSKTDLILAVVEGRDGPVDGQYDVGENPTELLSRMAGYLNSGETADGGEHAKLITHIWSSAATDPTIAAVAIQRHAALHEHLTRQMTHASRDPVAASRAEVALAALIGYAALAACGYPLAQEAFVETLIANMHG